MVKKMVKENTFMQSLEIYIKVNGQMIKNMVKENTLMQMEIYMKVNG
jgi:hypothetical protein